ncbi:hypothetical protein V1512DRAFT_224910 [Lipomyces arxii]|uniref:uncharacterized protein n=1 Tax=Lipomyces arxii TaxID=56418 RepID=UPI0034CECE72
MGVLNLEDQLSFYMAYHHDKVNIFIHTVCVPIILVTSFTFCTNTGPLIPQLSVSMAQYTNLGVLAAIGYAMFYVLLDPAVGLLVAPFVVGSAVVATDSVAQHGMYANYVAIVLFGVSWIAQFIGHGMFERRAPALLDNLVQALVLAPFFVVFEVIFKLGFRKELQARLETRVEQELKKFKASEPSPAPKN